MDLKIAWRHVQRSQHAEDIYRIDYSKFFKRFADRRLLERFSVLAFPTGQADLAAVDTCVFHAAHEDKVEYILDRVQQDQHSGQPGIARLIFPTEGPGLGSHPQLSLNRIEIRQSQRPAHIIQG